MGGTTDGSTVRPLVSIVMAARNDNYLPDFLYRTNVTLNYLAAEIHAAGCTESFEIVFADWGSSQRLSATLALSPEAAALTRFVYVDVDTIRSAGFEPATYHASVPLNVAARRSDGRFITLGGADTIFTRYSLSALIRLCQQEDSDFDRESTYFIIPRRLLPWEVVRRQPDVPQLARYVRLNYSDLPYDAARLYGVSGGAGALMLSRKLFDSLHGLDEGVAGWGWNDIDFGTRASSIVDWCDTGGFGVECLHLEHPPAGKGRAAGAAPVYRDHHVANLDGWGLADAQLCIERATPSGDGMARQNVGEVQPESALVRVRGAARALRTDLRPWPALAPNTDALAALAFAVDQYEPQQVFLIGCHARVLAATLGALSASVELYVSDQIQNDRSVPDARDLAAFLKFNAKHTGYLRFLSPRPAVAVESIERASLSGSLVLLQQPLDADLIMQAIRFCRDRAHLLITGSSDEQFLALTAALQAQRVPFACAGHGRIIVVQAEGAVSSSALTELAELAKRLHKAMPAWEMLWRAHKVLLRAGASARHAPGRIRRWVS